VKVIEYAAGLFIVALGVIVLVVAKALLIPLAIAIALTFLINTLADYIDRIRLGELRIPRRLSIILASVVIIALLALFIDIIVRTFQNMVPSVQAYQLHLEQLAHEASQSLGLEEYLDTGTLFREIDLKPLMASLGTGLSSFAGHFVLIVIYVIFLLLEQRDFEKKFDQLFRDPERFEQANEALRRISESVKTYISVKTFTSFLTAILSFAALRIIGVEYAVFWSFLIFLFNFIPNLGSMVATALTVLYALIQFDSFGPVLTTLIVIVAIQLVVGNYIDPRLMGRRLNISPLVVLFSLVLWGSIWGVIGMFLSVPMMVILMIILAQFPGTRKIAMFMSQNGRIGKLR
jgi:predicted PurR-regulated permease PerM